MAPPAWMGPAALQLDYGKLVEAAKFADVASAASAAGAVVDSSSLSSSDDDDDDIDRYYWDAVEGPSHGVKRCKECGWERGECGCWCRDSSAYLRPRRTPPQCAHMKA